MKQIRPRNKLDRVLQMIQVRNNECMFFNTINIASEIEKAVNNFLTSFFILLEFFLPVRGSMYLDLLSL